MIDQLKCKSVNFSVANNITINKLWQLIGIVANSVGGNQGVRSVRIVDRWQHSIAEISPSR